MKTENEWLEELKDKLTDLGFEPLTEVLKTTNADLYDFRRGIAYLDDEVVEYIDETSDITYYSSAMEFLTKHDNSLRDSLELAGEMCYKAQDLNSEILASLLNASRKRQEWDDIRDKADEVIEEFFEENGEAIDSEEEESGED